MALNQFELWLDESGDFKNDNNKHRNPSLVGGVLVEKDNLSRDKIKSILGSEYVHSNEISASEFGEYAVKILKDTLENKGNPIIFENEERLKIVDSTTTYLNIISEGIIQLLQLLSAEHETVELNILVAVRLDMERQVEILGGIIPYEAYVFRLEERIILGLARRMLSDNRKWKWNIELASARKDVRLMLADVVCNSWLTRNSRKFEKIEKEVFEELYIEKYKFTVFEKATSAYIKRLIAEGDLSEAIFEVYTSEEKSIDTDLVDIILKRLSALDSEGIRLQLLNLKNKIGTLVKINKDFMKSKQILSSLQDDFIVKMKNKNINPGIFALDIYLYLLTVSTHEGDILASEKQIVLCEDEMNKLANRWESIDYFFMFKIRQAVHKINCFDFDKSYEEMTNIINSLKETMGLFSVIDGLDKLYDNLKSDILGKALGTRLQASCMMLRKKKSLYDLAIEDSKDALKEFSRTADICRQYQYRSQLECEAENYVEALKNLLKVTDTEYEDENSVARFLNSILQVQLSTQSFAMMHYTRIMAQSAINKDMDFAKLLYELLLREKDLYKNIINNGTDDHPYEIIVWKLATYLGLGDNILAAKKLYDQAIAICFSRPERWTLIAIGLGILAEKSSILYLNEKHNKEADIAFKELVKRYNNFIKLELPESMRSYFLSWDKEIERVKSLKENKDKYKVLWKLSRDITY